MNFYFDDDNTNDSKSGRNGYTNSGFKRCVDTGWKVRIIGSVMYPYVYGVIDINHEGHEDVNKVLVDFGKGMKLWYFIEEIEIYPKEDYPEYYL